MGLHPDGSLMSTVADQETISLRIKAHNIARGIWDNKGAMYLWMSQNTAKGHIGKMHEPELKKLIKKLKTMSKRKK